jgi:hypothetical protein
MPARARDAAFAIAMSGAPVELAAAQYGVSTQMVTWRVNATGSKLQAARTAARRRSFRRPVPGTIAPDQQMDHQNHP